MSMSSRIEVGETTKNPLGREVILWFLFFLISMGLGYPTLNRFDPGRFDKLFDPGAYASMVTGAPLIDVQQDLGHRILVPYLARPIYWIVRDHLNSWNPAYFSLLVVNSFFTASTAWLLTLTGRIIAVNQAVALIAPFLYLGNFVVANLHLSGNVDSSIDFVLMAITWSLLANRWWTLPVWGIVGSLAKETFIPLAVVYVFAWYLTDRKKNGVRISHLAWIASMAIIGFSVLTIVMSHQPTPYNPLSFAASRRIDGIASLFYLPGLFRCLTSHEFVFAFAWLLPLGLPRLSCLPRGWVAGAMAAALAALAMGAYNDALGSAVRPMFGMVGPLLSLSAAIFLTGSPSKRPSPWKNVQNNCCD
jgi:hypothetical protein